jgi:hypothetical protein
MARNVVNDNPDPKTRSISDIENPAALSNAAQKFIEKCNVRFLPPISNWQ